jgi:hypothetical protein
MFRRYIIPVVSIIVFTGFQYVTAQEVITSTPVRINVPTDTAPEIEIIVTATITRTPTPSAVLLEAKESAGEVNVRAGADIEADRLGTIRSGEFYPVLGRYFRWIQFQFDSSPSGRAWVFDELVDITGDESTIPDLSEAPLPTTDPIVEGATQTEIAITQTPGGILTLTAESRILPVPGQTGSLPAASIGLEGDTAVINALPTFTYPPDIVAVAPTQEETTLTPTISPDTTPLTVPERVPPIVPILLLGAGGLLGLIVSSIRR